MTIFIGIKYVGNTFLGIRSRVRSKCCAQELDLVSVPLPVVEESIFCSGNRLSSSVSLVEFPYHLQSEVIVDFVDEDEAPDVGMRSGNNAFSIADKTHDTELMQFLSRPVRILTSFWSEGDPIGLNDLFNPWEKWGDDPFVKNKLNNYAFIRGNLKLKYNVSISPFYYGSMLVSYLPLGVFKPGTIVADAGTRYLIPYSQRPHILIEPQKNDTFTITLPFILPTNWLNVQNKLDWTNMGVITHHVIAPLRSANSAVGTDANIVVYAWMEDVELSGASVGYALQSDEYIEGPISKPASAIAKFASYLTNVPIIGPFAKATSIGASAVSSIASLFGFTNVPVISATMPLRSEPFPKFSSSEISYPVEKLTLDPKNELSVDPRIVGMPTGDDEMIISHIAARESLLALTTWESSDNIDDILFYSRVNPHLYDADALADSKIYMTPMSYVSAAFNEWRGDIIFRFKVVTSRYHKGKLRISFDPTGNLTKNLGTDLSTSNVVRTAIIDIGMTDEIEFRVPYQQATQFLTLRPSYASVDKGWDVRSAVPGTYPYDNLYDNGFLTVRVLNKLTSPTASSTVSLLVFVHAGDNIEFANPAPVDLDHRLSFYAPQSESFHENGPTHKVDLGVDGNQQDQQYTVHYGECIRSLRQLLRRYEFSESILFTTTVNQTQLLKTFYKLPPSPGYLSTAPWTANKITVAGTAPFNFTNMTLLNWFSNAFLCHRGSVNYSFNPNHPGLTYGSVRVAKDNQSGANFGFSQFSYINATASAAAYGALTFYHPGTCGSALTNQKTQAGINVQCPNYTKFKFQTTDPTTGNSGKVYDGSILDQFRLEMITPSGSAVSNVQLDTYVGAGTDFGLYFFLNVPTVWRYRQKPING